MIRLVKKLFGLTFWCALAAIAGSQFGFEQGYRRGVRDISSLIIVLHDASGSTPEAPASRHASF